MLRSSSPSRVHVDYYFHVGVGFCVGIYASVGFIVGVVLWVKGVVGLVGGYPYPLSRLFVNVVTLGLAVFLVSVLVRDVVPLLVFVVATGLLTGFRLFVKVKYVFRRVVVSEGQEGDVRKSLLERGWRVMFLGLVAIVVALPLLFLATQVLPVYVWLTVTASVASGFGLSEVLFYIYCRRQRSEVP